MVNKQELTRLTFFVQYHTNTYNIWSGITIEDNQYNNKNWDMKKTIMNCLLNIIFRSKIHCSILNIFFFNISFLFLDWICSNCIFSKNVYYCMSFKRLNWPSQICVLCFINYKLFCYLFFGQFGGIMTQANIFFKSTFRSNSTQKEERIIL